MLAALGDLLEDVIVWLDGPMRVAADTPSRIFRRRGGSAANVAAAMAALGASVRFLGQVGADPAGMRLADELGADGVEVCVRREGRTGTVVVLVAPDGERTMLTDRATATGLAAIDEAWLEGVEWLHVPAYCLAPSTEPLARTAMDAAQRVRAAGGRVSVDASSTTVITALGAAHMRAMLASMAPTVLFANAEEAGALGTIRAELVVVKQGPHPVRLLRSDGPPTEVPVAAIGGSARDTTGAGDAFAAGFLVARRAGASDVEAVTAASRLAATTLGSPGASSVGSLLRQRPGKSGPTL